MNVLALMITRRCTMTCAHCSVESSPKLREQPTPAELLERVTQAADAGITQLLLTGGEPMMRYEVCLQLIVRARQRGLKVLMVSNGFWGKQADQAQRQLRSLVEAGLCRLSLSYDRYHHQFQGPQALCNIIQAAAPGEFPIDIVVTRNRDDHDLEGLIQPFRGPSHVQFRFYDIQAVGAARNLPAQSMRGELEGHCSACSFPALTDDGRLTACNGPSYFMPPGSPLAVGQLNQQPLAELLRQHGQDVILETIRTQGPRHLQRELLKIPGFQDYPFKSSYSGACELCLQINSDPRAVAALRQRLDNEGSRAVREAIRQVTEGSRTGGRFRRDKVNTSGIVQLLLQLLVNPRLDQAESILGRADLDWSNLLHRVLQAGLARPLLSLETHFQRWAPQFFLERLYQEAARDQLRAQLQQESVVHMSQALHRAGQVGVLLGGCALAQIPAARPRAYPQVEVWLTSASPAGRLPVSVRTHLGLLPPHWRLPEAAIWAQAVPIPDLPGLRILSPEAMLLTTALECSRGLFAGGLQAAWDVHTLRQHFPQLDQGQVWRWASQSAAPRACRVSLQVMEAELELGWFSPPPTRPDRRQTFLLRVARSLLFARRPHPQAADPWLRLACWLLLHESFADQLRCLLASTPQLWGASPQKLLSIVRAQVRR